MSRAFFGLFFLLLVFLLSLFVFLVYFCDVFLDCFLIGFNTDGMTMIAGKRGALVLTNQTVVAISREFATAL